MSATALHLPAPKAAPDNRWPRSVWALLAATFVLRAAGFTFPFLSYRLNELGFSPASVGRLLALFGVGWLIGQLICGALADRVGHRTTVVASMLAAAVALPVLAQSHSTVGVAVAAVIAGATYDAPRPVVSAAIADLVPTDAGRARVNGWRHFATNAGAAITGSVGGLLAAQLGTISALFWINAFACLVFALVALPFLSRHPAARPAAQRVGYRTAAHDGRLWLLSLASVCALTCTSSLFSTMPMLMADDHLSAGAYGITQAANAAGVIALSPLLTPWLGHRAARGRPLVGSLAVGSLVLGAAMGAAALATTTVGYSLAAILAVPGEILLMVAASDVLTRISPVNARGLYAGIWGSTLALSVIIAPLLASWSISAGGDLLAAASTLATGLLGAAFCLPLHALINKPSNPWLSQPVLTPAA